MGRLNRIVAVLTALTLVGATAAHADGYKKYKVCGGDNFATCAAVSINVVGSDVTVRVWNLSGNSAATYGTNTYGGTIFTGIGFYNVSGVSAVLGSLSVTGPAAPGTTPGTWTLSNNSNVNFGVDFRVNTPGNKSVVNGISSGCAQPGQLPAGTKLYQNPCTQLTSNNNDWVTFSFKINGTWNPSNTDIVLRGSNGPTTTGLVECWTGTHPGNGRPANCTTVTPEPVTMSLLATGLAGMGGVGALRRRKQKKDQAA